MVNLCHVFIDNGKIKNRQWDDVCAWQRTKKLHNAIKLCNLIIRLDRQLLQIIINCFLWTQKFKWGIQQKWSWSRSHHCVCQLFPLNRGSWSENPLPNISGQLNVESSSNWKTVTNNYQIISCSNVLCLTQVCRSLVRVDQSPVVIGDHTFTNSYCTFLVEEDDHT